MNTAPVPPAAPRPSLGADLKRRVPSAIAMGLVALAATWYGGAPFLLLWLVAALVVWFEWSSVVRATPQTIVFAAGALSLAGAALLIATAQQAFACAAILAGLAAVALAVKGAAGERGWAAVGVPYAALVFVPIVLLRADPAFGLIAVIWIYAVVWLTDIAAYFSGRFIGGPKLLPAVSPSKTWSGAIGGTLFAVAAGCMVIWAAGIPVRPAHALLALAVSVFSQAGDLFESWVKRRFGRKDASGIIPGHGGLMDRLDAFIAASALAVAIGAWRGGWTSPAMGLLLW
jgi:phosphatidate cytidylyltransferase